MPTTVKRLIDGALRKFGALGTGDEASGAEYADALEALRLMLDAWSLESLMVPFVSTEEFDLVASQSFYSIGTGADWDTIRPEAIESLRVRDAGGRLKHVPESSRSILVSQATVEAGTPSCYLLTRDSRWLYVEFDALPIEPTVLMTSRKPFDAQALESFQQPYDPEAQPAPIYPSGFTLTGIQQPIQFPTGYEQAIVYNLALHLHPEYPGLTLPAEVPAFAARAKELVKRGNWPLGLVQLPEDLRPRRRHYDIVRGPGV